MGMAQSMMGNGLQISRKEWVLKRGQTVQSIMVTTSKAASREKEPSIGPMVQSTTVNSVIIIFMAMAITYGVINVSTMVSGSEIRCMVLAFSLGLMGELMKGGTLMTKSMATVSSGGLMGACMMVNGKQESNMGLARTCLVGGVRKKLVSGKTGVDYVGNRHLYCA